ncbi:MAG: sugar phosphate isomerase/epimerase [Thermoguttaceae bacterium]|nr:sugar phosphate isomerase/epimerase [Thermoguttaceae bacterium]MDW8077435.1 sugar phosphate isomerase/epimerase family protein [Thermoguttaceae bacterium]
MAKLPIAVDLGALDEPFREALRTAKELGADAIELEATGDLAPRRVTRTAIREIRHWLDNFALRCAAVRFRTPLGFDTLQDLDWRIAETKSAMEMAYQLGAKVVVNHIGRVPEDEKSDRWKLLQEVLTDLATYGARAGAILAAETGTEPGERLANLFARLPEGLIGVTLNPGALCAAGHSAEQAAAALGRWIVHVHATDAAGDLLHYRGQLVPLGLGAVDWLAVLAQLEEWNYRGYFCVSSPPGCDPHVEIRRAIGFLRRL